MKERDIFLAAVAIADPDERDAFLAEACTGLGQKQRLHALLDAESGLGTFLEAPARPRASTGLDEGPGSIIGPYKLLEEIGEGGMGVVFMAEQTQAVHRRVALKVIKPGMDSPQVIARFEAERQALALMEHPSIARVLDAGTTPSGRPYFVMELVRGIPITEYCDKNRVDLAGRLRLFVTVCMAIQHAHQKGIIHRDIKPSNVMVTLEDGQPVAKVIDFGIAKATEQKLTERTLLTAYGEMIGTPAYMSPEQAEMASVDVDTRSDIYSLGVLLYELLTGTTPLDSERLRTAGMSEIQRLIRDESPPRPSVRLSALGDAATVLASNRGSEPKLLARLLAGDLDWILMKAIDKDRDCRYRSPASFADDIERYLRGEAVEARPPSRLYRLRKFGRKHRTAVVSATVAALALLTGTALAAWQAIVATRAETKARQAQELAQTERRQAVTNLYHARVEEASALRQARRMGYRAQVFNRLQQALELDTSDKDPGRLRQEAVACLGDFVGLEPITWEDFPAGIRKIVLTPDGAQMAIALENGTIQLRSVSTGIVVAQLSESAVDLGIDSANRCLVTAGARGTIKVWNEYGTAPARAARTVEMRADFAGMSRNGTFVLGVSQQNDGGLLSLWDVARPEIKARLKVPSWETGGPFQVSDDGQWVAQAYAREGKLFALIWNTPVPEPKKIIFAETYQNTKALSMSPDGRFLACQHGDDGLVLIDVHESRPRPLIRCDSATSACFSQDGRFLVYYSLSARVILWNVAHHQEAAAVAHPCKGGRDAFSATFSGDGNTFATAAGVSRSVRIWKLAGFGEKLALGGHDGGVSCLAFSPDGKVLASGSKDRLVKIWDTATGRLLSTLPRLESPIQSLAFSPDGRLLATGQFGSSPQPVQIWDLATLHAFVAPDDELGGCAYGVAMSRDGKILAACGAGLTLWRVAEGAKGAGIAPVLSFKRMGHLPGNRSLCLCISPNGKLLAWVDHNDSVCIWDLANEREIPFIVPALDHGWHSLAFYPGSDHITFCTRRGMVETWDARTARRVSSFDDEGGNIAASTDGRWLATTDPALWSSQTGSRVFSLPQPNGLIWSVAVSPDGDRLAVGLADGGLAIWNVPEIQAQLNRIGLAWSADERQQSQESQPFVPITTVEHERQAAQYENLGRRLAWVGRLTEAEEAYRAALKLRPDDPSTHESFGRFLADQARYEEAVLEFNTAITSQPERSTLLLLRGRVYADLGQWAKASAEFVKASECKEPDEEAWYCRAMLCLRDGNVEGYRKVCSDMLDRFGTGAVWTCTLADNSVDDPARIVGLAERIVAKLTRNHWHVNQLGAALYRAGRFEEALKPLTEATELNVEPYRSNMLHTWFYLAMAHHRLSHSELARRWLDKAVQGTDEVLKSPAGKSRNPDGSIGPNWNRKLTLELLRREAEQVIQGPAKGI